ncbi:hypothetical protein quinque_008785 [Culex quinquefasciatus]
MATIPVRNLLSDVDITLRLPGIWRRIAELRSPVPDYRIWRITTKAQLAMIVLEKYLQKDGMPHRHGPVKVSIRANVKTFRHQQDGVQPAS